MKKTVLVALAATMAVGACTTDPYTGEQKVSNTLGGATLGAWPARASACWPAATTAATR